jgi:uncharacterized protein
MSRSMSRSMSLSMSLSMYGLSVPALIRGLGILSGYMDKAATFAAENNIDPAVLISARLAPDMFSLAGQIQRASDNSKGGIGRLAGIEAPSFQDSEKTFPELKARLANTIAFLETVRPEQLDGSESHDITLKLRFASGVLKGDEYLLQVLLPNFYFHIATVHDILRHNGVKIGKKDYIGEVG